MAGIGEVSVPMEGIMGTCRSAVAGVAPARTVQVVADDDPGATKVTALILAGAVPANGARVLLFRLRSGASTKTFCLATG